jgi:hypothetical protein
MQKQCLAGINQIFCEITVAYAHKGTAGRLKTDKKVLNNV